MVRLEAIKQKYVQTLMLPSTLWGHELKVLYHILNENLFEDGFSASKALCLCGLADHNTTTYFKRATGYTIEQYLISHRIACAKEILTTTNIPIVEIALGLGFSSGSSHFAMLFKKYVGTPPARFRKNAQARNL